MKVSKKLNRELLRTAKTKQHPPVTQTGTPKNNLMIE